jgi:hypothetical protein
VNEDINNTNSFNTNVNNSNNSQKGSKPNILLIGIIIILLIVIGYFIWNTYFNNIKDNNNSSGSKDTNNSIENNDAENKNTTNNDAENKDVISNNNYEKWMNDFLNADSKKITLYNCEIIGESDTGLIHDDDEVVIPEAEYKNFFDKIVVKTSKEENQGIGGFCLDEIYFTYTKDNVKYDVNAVINLPQVSGDYSIVVHSEDVSDFGELGYIYHYDSSLNMGKFLTDLLDKYK